MANTFEQAVVIRVWTDGKVEITKLADELEKLKTSAAGAAPATSGLGGALGGLGQQASSSTNPLQMMRTELAAMKERLAGTALELAGMGTQTSAFASAMGAVVPFALGATAAISAFRVILGPLAEAAGQAEETQLALAAAVKRAGETITDQAGRIEQAIQEITRTSVFDDEDLRRAATLFTTITSNAGAAESAMRPIADLAAVMGISLQDSARMIARAGEGMTGALGRAGIVFSDVEQKELAAASSGERLAMIFGKIEEKSAGAAAAQLQTYAGQVASVKKAWEELKEQLGQMGGLELAKDFFAGLTFLANKLEDSLKSTKEKLQEVADAGEAMATRGKVGSLYAPSGWDFASFVQPKADEENKAVQKANDLAAALAQAGERAVDSRQRIEAMFRDIAKTQIEIGMKVTDSNGNEIDLSRPILQNLDDSISTERTITIDADGKFFNIPTIVDGILRDVDQAIDLWKSGKNPEVGIYETAAKAEAAAVSRSKLIGEIRTGGLSGVKGIFDNFDQELDVVSKAIQEVDKVAQKMLDSVASKTVEVTNRIDDELAHAATLRAEIAAARTAGGDVATIAAKQRELAVTLQEVAADRQALELYQQMPGAIKELAAEASKVRAEAALVKAADEARIAFAKVSETIQDDLRGALSGLKGLPVTFAGPATLGIQDLFANYQEQVRNAIEAGFSEADLSLVLGQLSRAFKDGAGVLVSGAKAAAEAFKEAAKIQDELSRVFQDVFVSLATEGGKNFGDMASKMFIDGVRAGSKSLTDVLSKAVLGAFGGAPSEAQFTDPKTGKFDQAGFQQAQDDAMSRQQQIVGGIISAVGAIGNTIETFKNAAKGQQTNVLGSVVSYAAIGASIGTAIAPGLGTIIGAVVGAIAGGILAAVANAKAKKELPFAEYGIEKGQAYVKPFPDREGNFANVTAKQRADMIQRMEETLNESTSAYIKLLLKFGEKIFAALPTFASKLNYKPKQQGDTDDVAFLKAFNEDFELWVSKTLPKEIAQSFRAPVEAAFTAMGVTVDKFNEVWNSLQGMDPKKALELINSYADAVIQFREVFDEMETISAAKTAQGADLSGLRLNADGSQREEGRSDFMQRIAEAEKGVRDFALAVATLPFEDQVNAAKALGATLKEVLSNLVNYLNEIAAIEKGIGEDVAARKLTVELEQTGGDKTQQSAILKREYDAIVEQLRNAFANGLSPQEAEALRRRAEDLAEKAYRLDPTKAAADTYFKQLDFLAELAKQQLNGMATQAQSEVERLLALVKPFADYLSGVPVDLDPAFSALRGSLVDFSTALDLLSGRIAADAQRPNDSHNEPYTPDNPAPNPKFPGDDVNAPPQQASSEKRGPAPEATVSPASDPEFRLFMERQTAALEQLAASVEKNAATENLVRGMAEAMRGGPSEDLLREIAETLRNGATEDLLREIAATLKAGVSEDILRKIAETLEAGRDLGTLTLNIPTPAGPRGGGGATRVIQRTQLDRITRGAGR